MSYPHRLMVEDILADIRSYVGDRQQAFLYGACLDLYLYLRKRYVGLQGVYDPIEGHVLSLYKGRLYDARGVVASPVVLVPLLSPDPPTDERRRFSQMRRSAIRTLKETDMKEMRVELGPVRLWEGLPVRDMVSKDGQAFATLVGHDCDDLRMISISALDHITIPRDTKDYAVVPDTIRDQSVSLLTWDVNPGQTISLAHFQTQDGANAVLRAINTGLYRTE